MSAPITPISEIAQQMVAQIPRKLMKRLHALNESQKATIAALWVRPLIHNEPRASERAAAFVGVSGRSVDRALQVFLRYPDVSQRVLDGELTLRQAATAVRVGNDPNLTCERVYFIQAGGDRGAIKIGRSLQPEARVLEFQVGCPLALRLLGTMVPADHFQDAPRLEGVLHARFAPMRLHGEWFRAERPLIDFIQELLYG